MLFRSGRDADIGYYFRTERMPGGRHPEALYRATPGNLDVARTWTFIESLIDDSGVQYVFTDRALEEALYHHARDVMKVPAERLAWIFSYPKANRTGVLRHLRGHDDHLHVRWYAPRSVEAVGAYVKKHGLKAIKPLPVRAPVKKGDNLGKIARRHRTTIARLMAWNHLKKKHTLRIGQKLIVGQARPALP